MRLTDEINKAIVNTVDHICKNPLIFVSETDIHYFAMRELMKIPCLKPEKLYPTNCTIGLNNKGRPSPQKYKTVAIHKEYGHKDLPRARSDIVILNPKDISKINGPLNLKSNGRWLVPEYIIEFGTEKSAKGSKDFMKHLNNDIKKAKKSKKRGYVIHIQRNLCKSKGKKLANNRSKYEGYSNVIKKAFERTNHCIRLIVLIVNIGNRKRAIYKEGKIKIFKNGQFKAINQNSIKHEINYILTKNL